MKFKDRKVALGLSYFYLLLNTVCSLISSSLVVKTLGSTNYGIYQIATSFTGFLSLLNFGTGTVMTRNLVACRINKKSTEEENISTIVLMTIVVCSVVLCACVVLYFLFDNIYSNSLTSLQIAQAKKMFIIASLNLTFSFIFQTFEGIIHGNDDYVTPKLLSICNAIVRFVTVIILLPVFKSGLFLVLLDLLIRIVGIIILLCVCKKWYILHKVFSIKKFRIAIFKSTLTYATAMILQVFVNQSVTQIPKTIIGIFLTPEAVTVFSIALYIYSTFSSVCTVPVSIFLPSTVRAVEGKETKLVNWDFLKLPCRINSIWGGALLFGFFSIGRYFIILLYGKEQIDAWMLALILLIAMYINMIVAPCINVLDALNKRLTRSIIIAVSAGIALVLTLIFTNIYGTFAAVFSIAFSLLAGNTLAMAFYYKKYIGIPIGSLYLSSFKGILPSLIIPAAIVYPLSTVLSINFKNFILLGFLFVGILFACLLLFGFSKEEKNYLKKYLFKFLNKVRK